MSETDKKWWLTVSQNRQKKNLYWQVREKKRKELKNNWLWAADLGAVSYTHLTLPTKLEV